MIIVKKISLIIKNIILEKMEKYIYKMKFEIINNKK